MRRWRVGTISLGIVLIALGVGMLFSLVRGLLLLETFLKWWPLVLVLLGLEILVYLYTAKEPEPKVKYDTFSMFVIFLVLFASIGAYALTATGLFARLCWTVASSAVTVDLPYDSIVVDDNVKKIVVSVPPGSFTVRRNSARTLASFGQATVNVADEKEIADLLAQCRIVTRREGDTLFVQFLHLPWQGSNRPGIREIRRTLLVPSLVDVEINGSYFNLDLDGRDVRQDWLIKGDGHINITLIAPTDLAVEAQVRDFSQLSGNVNWEVEEKSPPHTDLPYYCGRLKWGEGQSKLNIILGGGQVILNVV